MKFDFNKTLDLVKGGLLNPAETWNSYLGENQSWQNTLTVLTGPLILANVVLSLLLSRMFGTTSVFGLGGNWFAALVLGLVMAAIGFAVAVFAFNFLAGVFEGKPNFSRAFAALSLAAIPAWIAGIVGAAIPWLGGLVALAGAVLGLVFLYRILPLALEVPETKRVLHFVVSLVAVVIINMIVGSALGIGRMGAGATGYDLGARGGERRSDAPRGAFGEIGRQADLMAAANEDVYDPPEDGKVTHEQALWVADVVDKSRQVHEEEMARLQKLSEDVEDSENPSPADMARVYQGMGSVIGLGNVEMEVVKAGDGNWAEYVWVRDQLRDARLQRGEGSDALAHNFELYQEVEDSLQGAF